MLFNQCASGKLLRSRRPPGSLEKEVHPSSGSACDRGCSSGAGWGRAIQTSGRVDGDVLTVGVIPSPRLCKLGQRPLLRGRSPYHLSSIIWCKPIAVGWMWLGFEEYRRCVLILHWLQKPVDSMWPSLLSGDCGVVV
jgi:hypothetical protein